MQRLIQSALTAAILLGAYSPAIYAQTAPVDPVTEQLEAKKKRLELEKEIATLESSIATSNATAAAAKYPVTEVTKPTGTFAIDDSSANAARWLVLDSLKFASKDAASKMKSQLTGKSRVVVISAPADIPSQHVRLVMDNAASSHLGVLKALVAKYKNFPVDKSAAVRNGDDDRSGALPIISAVSQVADLAGYFKADFSMKSKENVLGENKDVIWQAMVGALREANVNEVKFVRPSLDSLRGTQLFEDINESVQLATELQTIRDRLDAESREKYRKQPKQLAKIKNAIAEIDKHGGEFKTWMQTISTPGPEGAPSPLQKALAAATLTGKDGEVSDSLVLLITRIDDAVSVLTKQWLWTNPRLYMSGSASIAYSLSDLDGNVLIAGTSRGQCAVPIKVSSDLKALKTPVCTSY